jgi:hypothetical protein
LVKLLRSATRTKVLSLFRSRSAAVKDISVSFRALPGPLDVFSASAGNIKALTLSG